MKTLNGLFSGAGHIIIILLLFHINIGISSGHLCVLTDQDFLIHKNSHVAFKCRSIDRRSLPGLWYVIHAFVTAGQKLFNYNSGFCGSIDIAPMLGHINLYNHGFA